MSGSLHGPAVRGDRGLLLEGPVWDCAAARLSWVDIELGRLHVGELTASGGVRPVTAFDLGDQLGCAVPAAGGGWVCGLGGSLAVVTEQGAVESTPALLASGERFNDGAADPQGRLVIGTARLGGPGGDQLLLRLEPDGALTVLDDAVGLSNGIAWSPDGRLMYHADTAARTVTVRDYGDRVGPARTFAAVDGMPDGLAVDAQGRVWVAVYDASRIDCFAPDGSLADDLCLTFPDTHTTALTFAGAALDVLVVTTGMPLVPGWQRARRSLDGYLQTRPAPAVGLPAAPWNPGPLPTRAPDRAPSATR